MTTPLQDRVPGSCFPRIYAKVPDQLGTVDGVPFDIQQPDLTEYILGYDWPNGGRIAQLRVTAAYGIGTCSVLINDKVVAGIDHAPISANARSQHGATADNVFTAGDDLKLRIDSGADSLLGVRGTLVISNRNVLELVHGIAPLPVSGEIPIAGDLIGSDAIPLSIDPPLRRRPKLKIAVMLKNSADEDTIFNTSIEPIAGPGDFSRGWIYRLSAGAIEGQILSYEYRL